MQKETTMTAAGLFAMENAAVGPPRNNEEDNMETEDVSVVVAS